MTYLYGHLTGKKTIENISFSICSTNSRSVSESHSFQWTYHLCDCFQVLLMHNENPMSQHLYLLDYFLNSTYHANYKTGNNGQWTSSMSSSLFILNASQKQLNSPGERMKTNRRHGDIRSSGCRQKVRLVYKLFCIQSNSRHNCERNLFKMTI